jgi:sugar transferase (PEP-CTERM system associated)
MKIPSTPKNRTELSVFSGERLTESQSTVWDEDYDRGSDGNFIFPGKRPKPPVATQSHLTENQCTIWAEDYFHEILSQEKRRTERSGKPVLLMLLDLKAIFTDSKAKRDICSDIAFLSSATRDSDIKGWYEYGSIMGVIFTEIGEIDINIAKARIVQKVTEGVKNATGIDYIGDHAISFKIIPEESFKNSAHKAPINIKKLPEEPAGGNLSALLSRALSAFMRQRCFLFLVDILLITLAQVIGGGHSGYEPESFHDYLGNFWPAVLLYPVALYIFGLYEVERKLQPAKSLLRLTIAGALVGFALAVFSYVIADTRSGLGLLGFKMILAFVFVTGWRMVYGYYSLAANGKTGTLVIGAGESAMGVYRLLKNCNSPYEVKGFIDDDPELQGKVMGSPAVVGTSDRLIEVAQELGIRSAIVAVDRPHTPRFIRAILEARMAGIEITELPSVYERFSGRVPVQIVEDQWLLYSDGFHLLSRDYIQKMKRLADFAISGLLLVLSFPLMLATALAIRLDSAGPVFYRQERVGRAGKIFRVFKFRSMTLDAEDLGAQWAQKRDPRVTRVGKWIRLFRIDELPQIWNVFLGEMSLIGPRPERPQFVKDLETFIPYYSLRHSVRPGISGWAQVNYPYGASIEDARRKLEYDLYYVKNMSLLLDLKIIFRTVGVVLMGDGAR